MSTNQCSRAEGEPHPSLLKTNWEVAALLGLSIRGVAYFQGRQARVPGVGIEPTCPKTGDFKSSEGSGLSVSIVLNDLKSISYRVREVG